MSVLIPRGGWLIVGPFSQLGSVPAHGAAHWNGRAWVDEGLGDQFQGDEVWQLPHHTILHGGHLRGNLWPTAFWHWIGGRWAPWPVRLSETNPCRHHLLERSDGNLVVAGSFTAINDIPCAHIADGGPDHWHALGAGLPWWLVAGVLEDPEHGLVAWGGIPADALRWDGRQWERPLWLPKDWGIEAGAIEAHPGAEASMVFVLVPFHPTGTEHIVRVQHQRIVDSTPLPAGMRYDVAPSPDGRVFLTAMRWDSPSRCAFTASWWDHQHITPAYATVGSDGWIHCIREAHDGTLLIGGDFSQCGGRAARCIVRVSPISGQATEVFGEGLMRRQEDPDGEEPEDDPEVTALCEAPDGTVTVSGTFDRAGMVAAQWAARWHDGRWTAMEGLGGAARALEATAPNRIVAAGTFRHGGTTCHLLAWDGRQWGPLGADPNNDVCDLHIDADGSVIIVGWFDRIGDLAVAHIARWDGVRWQPMGEGLNDIASSITRHPDGGWVVCGRFTRAGQVAACHVARWDGTAWSALGSGLPACPVVITTWKDCIIAGDMLPIVDGSQSALALWHHGRWQVLGTTGVSSAETLCVDRQGILHVGGQFARTGAVAAGSWGRFDLAGFLLHAQDTHESAPPSGGVHPPPPVR